MRKFAVILLGLATAALTSAATISKVGKIVLAQTEVGQSYAYCSFYSNINNPPEGQTAVKSLVPEDLEGSIEFYQNAGASVSTVYVSLTGFNEGEQYSFTVNQKGDISNRCKNIGNVFNPSNLSPPRGYIGKAKADSDGAINKSYPNKALVVTGPGMSSIVGRSCAVHKLKGTTKPSDAWSEKTLFDCSQILT